MSKKFFRKPRDMSIHQCRSENVPFIGRVDPSQMTDYLQTLTNNQFSFLRLIPNGIA